MKFHISDRALFLKMFQHLVGREVNVVVGGKPERVLVRGLSKTEEGFGFWVGDSPHRADHKYIRLTDIWELRLP